MNLGETLIVHISVGMVDNEQLKIMAVLFKRKPLLNSSNSKASRQAIGMKDGIITCRWTKHISKSVIEAHHVSRKSYVNLYSELPRVCLFLFG